MRPGVKTLIAGIVTFLLGAVVVPLLAILPLILGQSDDSRFQVPGRIEVTAEKPGRYYLWNDFRTIHDGRTYDRSEEVPDGLEIVIRDADGNILPLVSDGSMSSTTGSSAKRSIGYVAVSNPGKVVVEVTGESEERIFSFAPSDLPRILGLVFGGLGLAMLIGLAGIGLIVWGTLKLVRARQQGNPSSAPLGG